jgi:8-oxo-dGTP pyrophosphatase MutT (NUDIX family)
LLAFKRGTYNRVEDFLRGSQCVGFGGHVAESDLTLFNKTDLGLIDSAARELFEELQIPKPDRERVYTRDALKVIGALNDDSSAAGRRHFAFVLNYEVSGDPQWQRPERNEKSITQLRWLEPERDPILLWQFEYWSQLVLREFYPDAIKAQPAFEIRRKRPLTPPHLLCVLGSVGSGKSEATNVLRREFGYSEINSGQVLAQLLDIPPVPETPREKFQALAFKFITRADGPARLAAAIWKAAITAANPRLLVDGIRQMSTLRELNSLADKRKMRVGKLFVHTPPDVAYSFYQGRSGVNLDIHDFLKLREAPVEREVYGMIGTADAVLYNWAGKPMYQAAVRRLMSQVNA